MNECSQQKVGLTEEQLAVVSQPPSARVVVTSGAGTGKTLVLIERLAHLVAEHSLYPGAEILVLTFSRAVVAEIRRRLQASDDNAAHSAVYTFDAFATRLLAAVDPDGPWVKGTYDDRVLAAIRALQESEEARAFLSPYRHILIDEVQDLVGPRAILVTELLCRCTCGFTVLGDPAQRIYTYQVAKDPNKGLEYEFSKEISEHFGGSLRELSLSTNFRAVTAQVQEILTFGPMLAADDASNGELHHDLETLCMRLPTLGKLSEIVPALARPTKQTTAILCRTNGQSLLVAQELAAGEVPHTHKRSASERAVSPWLAQAMLGVAKTRISKTEMLRRLTGAASTAELSPEALWLLLKQLDPRASDDVDSRILGQRISDGDVPLELLENDLAGIIVSSIHRAKGLEFDRVIVLEPEPPGEEADRGEEARVLYVALTRARCELFIMKPPDTRSLRKHRAAGNRWVRVAYRGRRPLIRAIEVLGSDVDSTEPAFDTDSAMEMQEYIGSSVSGGDPVHLSCRVGARHDAGASRYSIQHDGRVVGFTTESFVERLRRIVGNKVPSVISGLRVDVVDTVAGSPDVGRRHGLGTSGLWLRVRVTGLGGWES